RSTARLALESAQKELDSINKSLDEAEKKTEKVVGKLLKNSLGTGVNVVGDESQYNKITANIKKVTEAHATAGMEQAEKEIKQIKDKFAKIRAEAQKFNADPANKANLIDISGLDTAELKAIEAVTAKRAKEKMGKVS